MKKYDNKTIEKLIFRYFNVRNIEISKFHSFYIASFKILSSTYVEKLKRVFSITSVQYNNVYTN